MIVARRISIFVTVFIALCRCAVVAQDQSTVPQAFEAQRAVWPVLNDYTDGSEQEFDVEQASVLWQQPAGQPAAPHVVVMPGTAKRPATSRAILSTDRPRRATAAAR